MFMNDYIQKFLQFMQSHCTLFTCYAFNANLILVLLLQLFYKCRLDAELKQYICSISRSFTVYLPVCTHFLSGYQHLDIFHQSSIRGRILMDYSDMFCNLCRTYLNNLVRNLHFGQIFTSFQSRRPVFYLDRS